MMSKENSIKFKFEKNILAYSDEEKEAGKSSFSRTLVSFVNEERPSSVRGSKVKSLFRYSFKIK